jgi:hypothetical protein
MILVMMTPLHNDQRSAGGATRAENQTDTDRKFLAMLAASRRPLANDVSMSDQQVVDALKNLDQSRRWLFCAIVGADGRTIRASLDEKTILHRLQLVGGAIGFIGLTVFGTPRKGGRGPSIQVYSKPLKKGTAVTEKLDRIGRKVTAEVIMSLSLDNPKLDTEV